MLRNFAVVAALGLLAGCGSDPEGGGKGTVHLWIGADRDTFTTCSLTVGCANGGPNNAMAGEIQVADEADLEQKRGYVRFVLPTLPDDAVIDHAYLELYHPATMGDGTSDDRCIPVARLYEPWDPFTITWQNQPLESATGGEAVLSLRSDSWVGADVTPTVRDHYADPSTNFGFAIYFPPGSQADKGFYSINAVSRKIDDLGLAPRLLLEVSSKAGGAISFPKQLEEGTDLPFGGETAVMGLVVLSDDFPEEWNVAIDDGRCL